MPHISKGEYQDMIKQERQQYFDTPFDLAYNAFVTLEYDKADPSFFMNRASEYVYKMRRKCWDQFVPEERAFTTYMLEKLINRDKISKMDPVSAIEDFVQEYPEHIYALSLSNTQSRRSRAGAEFEAIIELMLIGAGIPADTQGSIGKSIFFRSGLGKLVDFVSPGVVQYMRNKRDTTLISAKTTLRERWQEVPEEVQRTGTREMYLATLDENITPETIRVLYEANVYIVTSHCLKYDKYEGNQRIFTFEEMLKTASESMHKWNGYHYSDEEINTMRDHFEKEIEKHANHPYVRQYYNRRLSSLYESL